MEIEKVRYDVNWANFLPGTSIFIPCLDCPAARKLIRKVTQRLKMRTIARVVVEDGVKGLRVWRV